MILIYVHFKREKSLMANDSQQKKILISASLVPDRKVMQLKLVSPVMDKDENFMDPLDLFYEMFWAMKVINK